MSAIHVAAAAASSVRARLTSLPTSDYSFIWFPRKRVGQGAISEICATTALIMRRGDRQCSGRIVLLLILIGGPTTQAAAEEPAPPAPAPVDVVTLKDGSVIYGEVLEMAGGILFLKNPSVSDNMIKLKWEDVSKLNITHPIPFHLKEGTILNGTATPGPDGVLVIHAEPAQRYDGHPHERHLIAQSPDSTVGHLHRKPHRRLFANDR